MSARHPLPYTFCRDQAVLAEDDGQGVELWMCEDTRPAALAEVQRQHVLRAVHRTSAEDLQARIGAAYAARDGSAAAVGRATTVSVVQSIFLVIVIDAGFSVLYNLLQL